MSTKAHKPPQVPPRVSGRTTCKQAPLDAGPLQGLALRVCVEKAIPTSNVVLQSVALAREYTLPSLGSGKWNAAGVGGHITISTPARFTGEGPEATDDGSPPSPFSKPRRRFPWEPE